MSDCAVANADRTVTVMSLDLPLSSRFACFAAGVVYEVFKRHSEMSNPAMAHVGPMVMVMPLHLPPFEVHALHALL